MDLSQKFDRGRSNSASKKRSSKKKKQKFEENWKGSEDVEKLAAIFTTYMTQARAKRKESVKLDGDDDLNDIKVSAADGNAK